MRAWLVREWGLWQERGSLQCGAMSIERMLFWASVSASGAHCTLVFCCVVVGILLVGCGWGCFVLFCVLVRCIVCCVVFCVTLFFCFHVCHAILGGSQVDVVDCSFLACPSLSCISTTQASL